FDGLIQKSVLDVFFLCVGLFLIGEIVVRLAPDDTEAAHRRPDRGSVRLEPDRNVRSSIGLWFALGLSMGALALTRETARVFTLVILAWALVVSPQSPITNPPNPHSPIPNPRPAARAQRALLFIAGLAVVLAPVAARNAYVGGGFYITTSQFGPNF